MDIYMYGKRTCCEESSSKKVSEVPHPPVDILADCLATVICVKSAPQQMILIEGIDLCIQ